MAEKISWFAQILDLQKVIQSWNKDQDASFVVLENTNSLKNKQYIR